MRTENLLEVTGDLYGGSFKGEIGQKCIWSTFREGLGEKLEKVSINLSLKECF